MAEQAALKARKPRREDLEFVVIYKPDLDRQVQALVALALWQPPVPAPKEGEAAS